MTVNKTKKPPKAQNTVTCMLIILNDLPFSNEIKIINSIVKKFCELGYYVVIAFASHDLIT